MVFVWTFSLHCFFNNVKVRLNKRQRSRASETLPEQTSKRKSFATIVIVIAKLSIVDICRSIGFIIGCYLRICLLKVSDRNTRARGKLWFKVINKDIRRSGVFIVNFEYIRTPLQLFPPEFRKCFWNGHFSEHLRAAAFKKSLALKY